MKNVLRLFIGLGMLVLFCFAPYFSSRSFAQEKKGKVVTEMSHKARGDAKDENIKGGSDVNKAGTETPAPPKKGGEKSRGTLPEGKTRGSVYVDNYTPWYIKIYADGIYQGVVGPWGGGYVYGITPLSMYGKADFDDGSSLYWGPKTIYDGQTWNLKR